MARSAPSVVSPTAAVIHPPDMVNYVSPTIGLPQQVCQSVFSKNLTDRRQTRGSNVEIDSANLEALTTTIGGLNLVEDQLVYSSNPMREGSCTTESCVVELLPISTAAQ